MKPRLMPWLAYDGSVVHRADEGEKFGHDGGIERQRRRQLHQQWPSFLGEAIGLGEKREQGLSRVFQLEVMCNRSRQFHRKSKVRRRISRHFA